MNALADRYASEELVLRDSGDGRRLAQRFTKRYSARITGAFVVPGREGSFAPLLADLPPALAQALHSRGIDQLYSHQDEAWAATQSGAHVAIVTPTASGKSLCYTLPVITAAVKQHVKALYLFPTKALAQDQVTELLELNQAGNLGVKAFTFDGDTPVDARQAIRLHGDIVVSNRTCAAPSDPAASHQVGAVLRESALYGSRRDATVTCSVRT